jgi:hypothetical protein
MSEADAMHSAAIAVAAAAGLAVSGCATITSSETQPLSVTAQAGDGRPVEKASCTLRNDKGSWQVEAPGFVGVQRSSEDLLVECRKEGHPDGFLRAVSRAAAGMFGNIIFGGVVGAVIDHSKGTGYDYPNTLPVRLGASVVVDRRDEPGEPATERATGTSAPAAGIAARE